MTQTIRGNIADEDTQAPLIGATVMIIGSDPLLGATADLEGNFRILEVPVGRVDLLVRFLGYEERVIPGVTGRCCQRGGARRAHGRIGLGPEGGGRHRQKGQI